MLGEGSDRAEDLLQKHWCQQQRMGLEQEDAVGAGGNSRWMRPHPAALWRDFPCCVLGFKPGSVSLWSRGSHLGAVLFQPPRTHLAGSGDFWLSWRWGLLWRLPNLRALSTTMRGHIFNLSDVTKKFSQLWRWLFSFTLTVHWTFTPIKLLYHHEGLGKCTFIYWCRNWKLVLFIFCSLCKGCF